MRANRLLAASVVMLAATSTVAWTAVPGPVQAYVGTYTPNGPGIRRLGVDTGRGNLTPIADLASTNASWIAFDAEKTHLYAVNESFPGTVSAYAVAPATGALTLLDVTSSGGNGPVHVSVDPLGQYAFVANYGSGSVEVLAINGDGSLGAATDVKNDVDACTPACPVGPTKAANGPPGSFAISGHDAPHASMAQVDPAGHYVLVEDIGLDLTIVWQLDRSTGRLTSVQTVPSSAGAGPRHLAFHPNGEWVYSLNEEASTLSFMTFDAGTGLLTPHQEVSTLPPDFVGTSFASEVVVSADGKFAFVANRLHDAVTTFRIDHLTGALTFWSEASTGADYPRSIGVDPTGHFLYACNQRGDAVTAFKVRGNGKLVFARQYMAIGSPAVIAFRGP